MIEIETFTRAILLKCVFVGAYDFDIEASDTGARSTISPHALTDPSPAESNPEMRPFAVILRK